MLRGCNRPQIIPSQVQGKIMFRQAAPFFRQAQSVRVLIRPLTVILLLLVAVACGCSFQHPLAVKDDSFIGGNEKGVIVISVRRPFYGLALPTPTYRLRSTEQTFISILAHNSKSATPFNESGLGFVETLELPAGSYEIYNWQLFFNLGLSQWYERATVTVSIPFRVEAGKLNYLGEIALDNYVFKFRDMRERDLKIAFGNYPFLEKAELVYYPPSCTEPCIVRGTKRDQTIQIPIIPPAK